MQSAKSRYTAFCAGSDASPPEYNSFMSNPTRFNGAAHHSRSASADINVINPKIIMMYPWVLHTRSKSSSPLRLA
eukprot:CAMPEP_0180197222 /NCGR_PEP_ID=MMETSP0987-20121128/4523_1 /TAXON_ID=697907 /ORGANISM="non described non described, Strain CCMP2293" /LENGTH=74 /DNA_ID=CAMNT_0022152151 /DNA_START=366 /DNA_END=586 /DNA_ORIENTATION=+